MQLNKETKKTKQKKKQKTKNKNKWLLKELTNFFTCNSGQVKNRLDDARKYA